VVTSLATDGARLDAMRAAARAVGRPQAAETIAKAVLSLADGVVARRRAQLSGDVDKAGRSAYTPTGGEKA